MKILVFNRMKHGYSYEEACEHVQREIQICIENNKKAKKEKDQEDTKNKTNSHFRDEFKKLANG